MVPVLLRRCRFPLGLLWLLFAAFCLLPAAIIAAPPGTAAAAATKTKKKQQRTLCADERTGVYVGLAIDEESYSTVPGSASSSGGGNDGSSSSSEEEAQQQQPQNWELTPDPDDPSGGGGPQHSYGGSYLQVLPDVGRSYPTRGKHLTRAEDLDRDGSVGSPFVSFSLRVKKDGAGIHTLFLRWTGGDTVGGGDSLYVVLYKKGKKKNDRPTIVHGQQTVKPAVIPIDAGMSKYSGCCYDTETHACPCYSERPPNSTCPESGYIERESAAKFGIQCRVGGGAVVIVRNPGWYLFAGQEAGDVMDFDSEPWDVTCEADGSNTKDSGHDFPSWFLDPGEYELRVYAREDGTALDGIYVAGPNGEAPSVSKRYAVGESTLCESPDWMMMTVLAKAFAVLAGIAALAAVVGYAVLYTDRGSEIANAFLLSKPAQAVRYVYVDNS